MYHFATKIRIVAIDPILARRIEDVEVYGIFEGVDLVRDIWRDAEDLAGMNDDAFAGDQKLESTLEDICDLLVVVMVQRDICTLLEKNSGDHDIFTYDKLPSDQRVHWFDFDIVPLHIGGSFQLAFHVCTLLTITIS
jgi:hypothetical protein